MVRDNVLTQINRMNQRGGRMLSVIDLIKAGTLSVDLAAHLAASQLKGISILSGARTGGAGKTTLLASILAFTPPGDEIITVTAGNLSQYRKIASQKHTSRKTSEKKSIFLCHEISPASYFSYLWGENLKDYFALADSTASHICFTIHADSPEEACPQLINNNT
ncbi:MAG: hypothetical protein ACOC7U_07400, partial [Spirochaetota bacterium]